MATSAWQPPPLQTPPAPMPPTQGHWGASNTAASPQQGPPQGPQQGPPQGPMFSPVPVQQNATISNPNSSNSTTRPILAPGMAPGAQHGGPPPPPPPQTPPSFGMSPNAHPGTRWAPQQAGLNSGPMAGGARPGATEGPRPGLAPPPPPPVSSGLPSNNGAPPQQPPQQQPTFQGYPPNVGPGPLQQMGPPWMQPGQHFQRPPPFMHYPGNFPGPFQGQMRPLGPPSNGMPGGPPLAPGFAMSAPSSQRPVMWAPGPVGASTPMSTATTTPDAVIRTTTVSSAGSANISEKDLSVPGQKAEKGSSQAAADPADMWTAHKTDKGAVYYYNSVTAVSTYTRPEGFKGEAAKVTTQPTPVSWERLSSTDWALVTTDDGKKYYYNTKSQASCWQVPPEVAELRKKQEDVAPKPAVENVSTGISAVEKSPVSFSLNVPAAATGGREAIGHKAVANSALDLIKKKLQDSGAPMTVSPTAVPALGVATAVNGAAPLDVSNGKGVGVDEAKEKLHKGDHASSDDSSESDEEDPEPTKEQKVNEFKEMLKEKSVAPFSKWEKELPKIIFDPRFKAIPSHTERRSIFEHYVRTRADVERREKRAAQKAAIEGFKQLLEEASKDISHSTTYDNFANKWGEDSRFESLERKDRESLLNERVAPLRKAEEEKVRAERAAAVAGFRSLLSEKGEISSISRWSKVKESLRSDPRYKLVQREEREELFDAIIAELRAAELEVERAAKAKKEEEDKLREKEREARKRKECEEQELERVRVKARRKDAATAYQALLTEKIKDPETTWNEARSKLEKDSLGRASNPDLEAAEKERVFRAHIDGLYSRCVRDFRALLSEVITPEAATKHNEEGRSALNSYHEAKKLIKADPRYSKMPRRERESQWRKHADDVQRRMKASNPTHRASTPPRHTSSDHRSRSPGRRSPVRRSSPPRRSSPARRSPPGRRSSPARRSPPRRSSPGRRPSPGRRGRR